VLLLLVVDGDAADGLPLAISTLGGESKRLTSAETTEVRTNCLAPFVNSNERVLDAPRVAAMEIGPVGPIPVDGVGFAIKVGGVVVLLIAAVALVRSTLTFMPVGRRFNDPRFIFALSAGSKFGFCYVQFPDADKRIGLRQRQYRSKKNQNQNGGTGKQPTGRSSRNPVF